MTTRYGLSPWIREIPKSKQPAFPRLRGERQCEVVVVGGGLTGVCAAHALASAGVSVTLVDDGRIGAGTSGRGPGLMAPEPTASYIELQRRHGRRAARAMHDLSRHAALDLIATVRRMRIAAALQPLKGFRYVPPFQPVVDLQREVAARESAGIDAVWRRPSDLARDLGIESEGGARLPGWAWADPYRLLLGFAAAAVRRRAEIFERSRVTRIRAGRAGVEVVTEGGRVRGDTVMICTGEPGPLFRPLTRHVAPEERYAVLTDVMPPAMRRAFGKGGAMVSVADPAGSAAVFVHGHRLLMTGAPQAPTAGRQREKALVQRTGQLMYDLLKTWPAISGLRPAYGWEFPAVTTGDGALYAGPHRGFPRHLFAWGADQDPARAFLASRILVRHHQQAAGKADQFFALTRG